MLQHLKCSTRKETEPPIPGLGDQCLIAIHFNIKIANIMKKCRTDEKGKKQNRI